MTIHEPMTLLTDLVLAAFTIGWGVRLVGHGRRGDSRAVALWGAGLTAAGVGALAGGIFHGFAPAMGDLPASLLWKTAVYAVGGAGLAMLAGILTSRLRGRVLRWCLVAAALEFGLYAFWMVEHDDFRYVVMQYAPVMVVVLIVAAVLWREGRRGGPWIVGGILVSFIAAAIQQAGLGLHPDFNHNDVYHLVQLAANYLLYRGGRHLGE